MPTQSKKDAIESQNTDLDTLLMIAIRQGFTSVGLKLVQVMNANTCILENRNKQSALTIAIEKLDADIVFALYFVVGQSTKLVFSLADQIRKGNREWVLRLIQRFAKANINSKVFSATADFSKLHQRWQVRSRFRQFLPRDVHFASRRRSFDYRD